MFGGRSARGVESTHACDAIRNEDQSIQERCVVEPLAAVSDSKPRGMARRLEGQVQDHAR